MVSPLRGRVQALHLRAYQEEIGVVGAEGDITRTHARAPHATALSRTRTHTHARHTHTRARTHTHARADTHAHCALHCLDCSGAACLARGSPALAQRERAEKHLAPDLTAGSISAETDPRQTRDDPR